MTGCDLLCPCEELHSFFQMVVSCGQVVSINVSGHKYGLVYPVGPSFLHIHILVLPRQDSREERALVGTLLCYAGGSPALHCLFTRQACPNICSIHPFAISCYVYRIRDDPPPFTPILGHHDTRLEA